MNNVSARFKLHQLFVSCFVTCDALSVLFQISFVQQRPVPCTGLHCTPPRKAREIKDPQVLCPLHRVLYLCVSVFCSVSLCSVLCLCVSVFCAQRWSSKPDLFALPHARRRRQRNTCFSILFICPQCVIARSRPSTRRRACRVHQLVLVQSRRVQDAIQCIVSRMVQHAEVYKVPFIKFSLNETKSL